MDEQFKNLKFDMDEEIEARNEREGRRVHTAYRATPPISVSHAIVLAAIIIVGGLWGGKLVYDYIQQKRVEAALSQFAHGLDSIMQESNVRSKQYAAESRARTIEVQRSNQLVREQAERTLAIQASQAQQNKRMLTKECQFWWQQHSQNPSGRTEEKRKQYCGQ